MRVPQLVITRYGGPEVFEVQHTDLPAPGPGQARVAVRAAGINFAEVFCRLGLYKAAPKPPFVPGFEIAGTVVDVGPGVALRPGDRVLGVTRFGGYQGGVVVEAARLRPIPEGWSFDEAAAFPAAALTAAYGLLEPGALRAGEWVVIHSAAGGVGSTAVQVAQAVGARVIGTCGSDAKLPVLEQLGCNFALNYRQGDWAQRVRDEVGPVDVIFDALGGPFLRQGYDLLDKRGRLVCYGFGSMTPAGRRPNWLKLAWQALRTPRFGALPLVSDCKVVAGFNVLLLWDELALLGDLFDRCVAWAGDGKLRPRVSEVVPYTEVGALHERLQGGGTTGKLVLRFPGPAAGSA